MPQIAGETVKAFAILGGESFAEHSRLAVSARTGADRLQHAELVCAACRRVRRSRSCGRFTVPRSPPWTCSRSERLNKVGSDLVGSERRSPEYLAAVVGEEIRKWEAPISPAAFGCDQDTNRTTKSSASSAWVVMTYRSGTGTPRWAPKSPASIFRSPSRSATSKRSKTMA